MVTKPTKFLARFNGIIDLVGHLQNSILHLHYINPDDVIIAGELQFRNSAARRTIFTPKREANVNDLPAVEHGGAIFVCAERWRYI